MTFLQNIELAEDTLNQQKQMLQQKGANVKDILRKHKVSYPYMVMIIIILYSQICLIQFDDINELI